MDLCFVWRVTVEFTLYFVTVTIWKSFYSHHFHFLTEKLPSPEVEIDVLYIHPLLSINIGFSKEPLPNKGEVKETFFHVNTCWQLGCQFMSAPLLSYVHEKKVYESYWLIAIEMLDNLCASFAGCSAEW